MNIEALKAHMSQCSPVWETGTIKRVWPWVQQVAESQCSPVWETGTIMWQILLS